MRSQFHTRAADQVHAALIEEIVAGRLTPGSMLSETALGERFDVSRTPVREALHRLQVEGLAERGPRRVFIVRRMDVVALRALFEAVGELEALVAAMAAQRMSLNERRKLMDLLREGEKQTGDLAAYGETDARFHAAISAGCHNPVLSATLADLTLRTLPWRSVQLSIRQVCMEASQAEHQAICEAIMARDAEAAARVMRAHMARVVATISEALCEANR